MYQALFVAALIAARPAAFTGIAPVSHSSHQPSASPKPKGVDWYVSWGYNTAQYAGTDIQFVQPMAGNDFTLVSAAMHDSKAWDIWNHPITVPQYSWRVGKFFRKNTAIEFNFDHAKAILTQGQVAHVTGTLNGTVIDDDVNVSNIVPEYQLNNGANFFLVNLVQRFQVHAEPGRTGSISLLAKAGAGFMVPHTQNIVLGSPNEAGFQYGGLGAGIEGVVRAHVYRMIYLEVAQKGFYGHYRNLHIAFGDAHQDLWAYVTVLTFGTTFNFRQ